MCVYCVSVYCSWKEEEALKIFAVAATPPSTEGSHQTDEHVNKQVASGQETWQDTKLSAFI